MWKYIYRYWDSNKIKNETTTYSKFPLTSETFILLMREAQDILLKKKSETQLYNTHFFADICNDLKTFFNYHNKKPFVVALEFPNDSQYIFPTDSYKSRFPTLEITNFDTYDELNKKDAQHFEMTANNPQQVFDVLTSSHKLLEKMLNSYYEDEYYKKYFKNNSSSVKIVLRKWHDYKASQTFLLTFRENDWILHHKYRSKCVDINKYNVLFKGIFDYIYSDKYINKTMEIHVSSESVFTILKISDYENYTK